MMSDDKLHEYAKEQARLRENVWNALAGQLPMDALNVLSGVVALFIRTNAKTTEDQLPVWHAFSEAVEKMLLANREC